MMLALHQAAVAGDPVVPNQQQPTAREKSAS